ncbi:MAG: NAD(P)H-hydrate dehydratase, partial [Oscillospiraceae bacterium]
GKKIAVICGSGNNGGDGVAAARKLLRRGAQVRVILTGKREKLTQDTIEMLRRLEEYGGSAEDFSEACAEYIKKADLIIDAMFGIGLNSALRGSGLEAARLINSSPAPVISADIPSGISADTGEVLGEAVRADVTVTFSLPKPGHFFAAGAEMSGKLLVHDIGIPPSCAPELNAETFTQENLNTLLPKRRRDTHKSDYGRVLMLCGSEGLTGAAALASLAALRSGAGLVSLGVPLCVYPIIASMNPEVMAFPLPDKDGKLAYDAIDEILDRAQKADVMLIGPGLGRSGEITELTAGIVLNAKCPMVIDADGLNALSANIDILKSVSASLVLTPHDGEFIRLGGDPEGDRLSHAADFAKEYGVTLVLKGAGTITARPDGHAFVNTTGNPGMATGGSGDVLSGIISSFIGQGLSPDMAAASAVFVHGLAGDVCARKLGQYGLLPRDIIEALPGVLP